MEVNDDRDNLGDEPFVLIVEDDPAFASVLLEIAHQAKLKGVVATVGAGTVTLARKIQPHLITLDLGLSDIDGMVLLDLLKHDPGTRAIPVHVISGADRLAQALSLGAFGTTEKPAPREALLEVFSHLAEHIRTQPRPLPTEGAEHAASNPRLPGMAGLTGARILIVDDDIRNIYSLTSVLESYDVEVLHAEGGHEGIRIVEQTPDIDVALIDIMMPEMDGYETMQRIRSLPRHEQLPLIAVTAKAMKGDRQKCLDAGASDYIAKPVDIELLLALLRVWVARSRTRPVSTTEE